MAIEDVNSWFMGICLLWEVRKSFCASAILLMTARSLPRFVEMLKPLWSMEEAGSPFVKRETDLVMEGYRLRKPGGELRFMKMVLSIIEKK